MDNEHILRFARLEAVGPMSEVEFEGDRADPCTDTVEARFPFPSIHLRNAELSGNMEPLYTVVSYVVKAACMGVKGRLSPMHNHPVLSPRRYHVEMYSKPEEDKEYVVVRIDGIRVTP